MVRKIKTENSIKPKDDNKESKKGFIVLDSNGKKFRVVDKEEEAIELAKHIGGRIGK